MVVHFSVHFPDAPHPRPIGSRTYWILFGRVIAASSCGLAEGQRTGGSSTRCRRRAARVRRRDATEPTDEFIPLVCSDAGRSRCQSLGTCCHCLPELGLAVGPRETVAADLGAGATLLFVPGLRTSGACVPVHRVLAGEFDAEANATRPTTAIRFAAAVSNGAA
jgi:hypothetical protein